MAGGYHARQLGIHHGTVDRVLSQTGLRKVERPRRPSLMDPYPPLLIETLKHYPTFTANPLYADEDQLISNSLFSLLITPKKTPATDSIHDFE